jgi:hypothetical protein
MFEEPGAGLGGQGWPESTAAGWPRGGCRDGSREYCTPGSVAERLGNWPFYADAAILAIV